MSFLVTARFTTAVEQDAVALADDLRQYLEGHPDFSRFEDLEVRTQPLVPGGASDPGPAFDRTAARTSGVTVDVAEPGGITGMGCGSCG